MIINNWLCEVGNRTGRRENKKITSYKIAIYYCHVESDYHIDRHHYLRAARVTE